MLSTPTLQNQHDNSILYTNRIPFGDFIFASYFVSFLSNVFLVVLQSKWLKYVFQPIFVAILMQVD